MKPLVSLLLTYIFLDKSFDFVAEKKHSFDKVVGKTLSLSLGETFRHLLSKKTTVKKLE